MNEQEIEQEIQNAGLVAPRVKPEDLTANIVDTEYVKFVSKSGQVLRWAILTTQSGYAVVGKPSVSVSRENDNDQIGRQVAYDNSRNELWPLMGYALKESLYWQHNGWKTGQQSPKDSPFADMPEWQQRVMVERDELQEKLTKLRSYQKTVAYFSLRDEARALLCQQERAMADYKDALNLRIDTF